MSVRRLIVKDRVSSIPAVTKPSRARGPRMMVEITL